MKELFETGIVPLCEAVDRFPWDNKEAYALYLSQTYYYLIHSTRLLGSGAARFSAEEEGLHRRYLDHAREEKSHHLLALKDLENLGYKIEDFREMPWTKAVYEAQYYKIEHLDPTALFGYIFALEGVSARKADEVCKRVESLYGKTATNFLRVHGSEDPDHLDKAFQWVSELDSRRMAIIRDNFEQSCFVLAGFFDQVRLCALGGKLKERTKQAA